MRYLGGKARLAKKFAPVLDAALASSSGVFVEPFVGGFNVVPALSRDTWQWAVCNDIHPGLINLYRRIQTDTFEPPLNLPRSEYERLRATKGWDDPKRAFAAFGCSFGGKEWGGYACGENRNYAAEAARQLHYKKDYFDEIKFTSGDYTKVQIATGDVIYCDPPYEKTTGYRVGNFDHAAFWDWCVDAIDLGARVFVSEAAPPPVPATLRWSHERKVAVRRTRKPAAMLDCLYEVGGKQ